MPAQHVFRPFRARIVRVAIGVVAAAALVTGITVGPSAGADAASRTYEVYNSRHHKKPVQWLDCEPIQYRINTASAPKGIPAVIKKVFASIHKQTGATFKYAGSTKHKWYTNKFSHTHPTIYFSFTKKHKAKGGVYFSDPGTVGEGAIRTANYYTDSFYFESAMFGDVILYSKFSAKKTGSGVSWQSLITHEIGHALNLSHRSSKKDVMYPELSDASPGKFSKNEVKALKKVLKRSSCRYDRFELAADYSY